jgi:hypothetical protein
LVKDYSFSGLLLSPGPVHLAILIFDLYTYLSHYWEGGAQEKKSVSILIVYLVSGTKHFCI